MESSSRRAISLSRGRLKTEEAFDSYTRWRTGVSESLRGLCIVGDSADPADVQPRF